MDSLQDEDLGWHALNYRTCSTADAHIFWKELEAFVEQLINVSVAIERSRWESQVKAMHEADDAYGCGFYNDETWIKHYEELRRMCGMNPRE